MSFVQFAITVENVYSIVDWIFYFNLQFIYNEVNKTNVSMKELNT